MCTFPLSVPRGAGTAIRTSCPGGVTQILAGSFLHRSLHAVLPFPCHCPVHMCLPHGAERDTTNSLHTLGTTAA